MVKIWIMKKENYYKLLYVGIILLIIGFIVRLIIDSVQYNVLLHRGLEKVDPEELNVMLGSSYANHLSLK